MKAVFNAFPKRSALANDKTKKMFAHFAVTHKKFIK